MSLIDDKYSACPSTPSDMSYSTVLDLRSHSPYQPSSTALSPIQTYNNTPFSPGVLGRFATIGSTFEGQNPAPFTVPPTPVGSIRVPLNTSAANLASDNSSSDLSQGFTSDVHIRREVYGLQNTTYPMSPYSNPSKIWTTQKTRYMQKDENRLQKLLDQFEDQYGEDHSATLDTASRLAWIYTQQGRYRSAETLFKRVAETWRRTAGDNDRRTLDAFAGLSNILRLQGELVKSERLIRNVYSRASVLMHQSDLLLLSINVTFGRCLVTILFL